MIELPSNILICGNTSCGKTYLLKKLLREKISGWSDYTIILSPTAKVSNDFSDFFINTDPNRGKVSMIFDKPKDFIEIVDEIVEKQDKIAKSKQQLPNISIILDDCVGYKILGAGNIIDKLSTKSRHYNISIIVLTQKIVAAPRTFRLNVKFFILFNCSNYSELERALEEYVPKKYKTQLISKLEEIYNEDYNFILCNNFARKLKERLWKNGVEKIEFN